MESSFKICYFFPSSYHGYWKFNPNHGAYITLGVLQLLSK